MPDEDKNGQTEEIKVNDRRRFTEDGKSRKGSDTREPAVNEVKSTKKEETSSQDHNLPAIDFPTFILSLATSAQVHLGVIANPATGKQESDLPLAKQTIDILGILQDKTNGNLTEDESRLLEHLLYDLRMMYVEMGK